ncbi:MAG TPA: ABC transporter ATP-binding protein [Actinospica sp.]|nr:ABC transporter ATP-binding protein [Actinospica sp.]
MTADLRTVPIGDYVPRKPIHLLRHVLLRSRGAVALALAFALASAGLALTVPYVVSSMVAAVGAGRTPVRQGIELAVLVIAGAATSGCSAYLLGRVGEYGVADIRKTMVRRMLAMRPADVRARGAGDLVARTTSDAAQLRAVSDVAVTAMPVSAVMVAASLILMGLLDWVLLLVVVATFALAGLAIKVFLTGMRRNGRARQRAVGALAERLTTVLAALPVIKAYRAEERVSGPIFEQVDTVARSAVASDRAQAFITPMAGLAQQIAIIGVLAIGGARLSSGRLSPAHYVEFLMYLFQIVNPLMTVASGFGRVQLGLSSVGRIQEVLRARAERPGPAAVPVAPAGAPALEFRSVSARYQGEDVLRRMDLTVPARGITAIVGVSGAGKTTVLNLAERFLDPRAGTIRLHGADVTQWPLTALRGRIAYVDQACTMLDATIRENVLLGCRTAPDDEAVFDALRRVGLAETVAALPEGLDTRLGGAGDLSGGQRQRLALVRALLSDADVLLLDEPSSQLDGPNEERLLAVLDEAARDRAVVVVAHRLSTIRESARIVYVEDGTALDAGTHSELLARCAGYRALVRSQAGAVPDRDTVGVAPAG